MVNCTFKHVHIMIWLSKASCRKTSNLMKMENINDNVMQMQHVKKIECECFLC